jgi:hypothetical protein
VSAHEQVTVNKERASHIFNVIDKMSEITGGHEKSAANESNPFITFSDINQQLSCTGICCKTCIASSCEGEAF